MHSSLIVLSLLASSVIGQSLIGGSCTSTSQCPKGAQCYAARTGLTLICGNSGASCTTSADCAYDACVAGSCGGVIIPSSSAVVVSSTPTSVSASASATASGTVLALGTVCTSTSQCAAGVQCYAVNSMLVAHCGNFQASCSTDAQCAFNTCVSGACSGVLSSSSSSPYSSPATLTSSASLRPTLSTSSSSSSSSAAANGGGQNVTMTTTGVPAGFTTSVTVINGVTSSELVNAAGATTSFGAVQTIVSVTTKGSGAGSLAVGMGGVLAVAGGVAMLL